ncbi:MAG: hypothetical protein ACXV76_10640 [Halobacteriota archaeon]
MYLFKSCVAGTFYPGIERSFRFVLNSLNVDYFDDPNHSSCTGFGVHCGVVPPEANLSLNARNLDLPIIQGIPISFVHAPPHMQGAVDVLPLLKKIKTV